MSSIDFPSATPPKSGVNKQGGMKPHSQISGKASHARVGKQYGKTGNDLSKMPKLHG